MIKEFSEENERIMLKIMALFVIGKIRAICFPTREKSHIILLMPFEKFDNFLPNKSPFFILKFSGESWLIPRFAMENLGISHDSPENIWIKKGFL